MCRKPTTELAQSMSAGNGPRPTMAPHLIKNLAPARGRAPCVGPFKRFTRGVTVANIAAVEATSLANRYCAALGLLASCKRGQKDANRARPEGVSDDL
jgi:hypothetical protein